jgi:flagellar protein FlgJ
MNAIPPLMPLGPAQAGFALPAGADPVASAYALRPDLASSAAGQAAGTASKAASFVPGADATTAANLAVGMVRSASNSASSATAASTAAAGGTGISFGAKTHSDAELQKVAKQFEAIFLRMLLKEMRATVEKNALTGNSRAMEFFESMKDEQYADNLSNQGIGLSDMIYRQLTIAANKNQRTAGS